MEQFDNAIVKAKEYVHNLFNLNENKYYMDIMGEYNAYIMNIRKIIVDRVFEFKYYYSSYSYCLFGGYPRDKLMFDMSNSNNSYSKSMKIRLFWKLINTKIHDIDVGCHSQKIMDENEFDYLLLNINEDLEKNNYPKLISLNDKLWEDANTPQKCINRIYNAVKFIFATESKDPFLSNIKFGIDFAYYYLVGTNNDFDINCLKLNYNNSEKIYLNDRNYYIKSKILDDQYKIKNNTNVIPYDIKLQILHNKINFCDEFKNNLKRFCNEIRTYLNETYYKNKSIIRKNNIVLLEFPSDLDLLGGCFILNLIRRYYKMIKYGFKFNEHNLNIPLKCTFINKEHLTKCYNCSINNYGEYYHAVGYTSQMINVYICEKCGQMYILEKKLFDFNMNAFNDVLFSFI